MASLVTYGGYEFHPAPFFSLNDQPVFLSGQFDYTAQSIYLIGQLTGCSLIDLKNAKNSLIAACSSGFQELTVGNTGFSYAKPVGINFQESKLTKILPFEITFEAFQNSEFSQFYGISDPIDIWTYSENEDRIVSASHEVSAKALKVSADSLLLAKNFVNGRLKGFDNLSIFFTGNTYILTNKTESLNRLSNSYSVKEEWTLSNSLTKYDRPDCIIRPNSKISFDGTDLSISVDGTMIGGISGSISTGYFSPEDAREYAKETTLNFKSYLEADYYDQVLKAPNSYTYNVNTGANTINFSFNFSHPDNLNTGDVNHEFSISFDGSKDSPFVTANLQGRVFYDSYRDVFLTGSPENGTRYQKVEAYFSGVDPYLIAQQYFNYYKEGNLIYSQNPLATQFKSLTIDKKPFDSSIEYSFSYSNEIDFFPNIITNAQVTITFEHSIAKYAINKTIDNSFCTQELYQTLERKIVSVNGNTITGVPIQQSLLYLSGWMNQYSSTDGTLLSSTLETGDSRISMSKTFVIK